jgi:hypothetical protein
MLKGRELSSYSKNRLAANKNISYRARLLALFGLFISLWLT